MSTPQPVPDGVSAMTDHEVDCYLQISIGVLQAHGHFTAANACLRARSDLARLRGGLGAAGAKDAIMSDASRARWKLSAEREEKHGSEIGIPTNGVLASWNAMFPEPAPPARPDSTLAAIAKQCALNLFNAELISHREYLAETEECIQRALDAATRGLVEENKKLRDAVDAGWWAMEFYLDDQGNYGWEISDNREDHMKKTMRTMKAALAPSGGKGAE